MNSCGKCGKPILWLTHKNTGKAAPIEKEPSVNGNILVRGSQYRLATNEEIETAKRLLKPLYLNHFASCPFAQDFKRS